MCRHARSLRAQLGQDSRRSYCTRSVPPLGWESPKLSDSRNKPAAEEERYCFPAFCATSVREWLYFLKIKNPTKQKSKKLCAVIDQLQHDTTAAGTVFMFPPTPHIAILSTGVICEDGDMGENTHRVSMSLWRRRNHCCVLSNPQQLGLLGINVFPLPLSGILVFFIQHDPMVCNWIEIHTVWIAITKAYLRRIAWKTCRLRGDIHRINAFSSLNYLQN